MKNDIETQSLNLNATDEELFVAYINGNERAMEVLLGRFGQPLFRTILRQVGNRATAEDIFQDTLERVIKHRDKYDPQQSFRGWVFSIAFRKCTDHFRKTKNETSFYDADGKIANAPTPEQVACGRESMRKFAKILATLPEEQREVFLLREEAGLTFAQIGQTVGRPLGTILTQMRSALGKLAKAVEE